MHPNSFQLNNRQEPYEDGLTIARLMRKKRFTHPMLIVSINGKYIEEIDYETARIHQGDDVKIIHPVAGG